MIEAIVKIFAKNPPSIAIAIAGLLALTGQLNEAYTFLVAGIFMQGLWILGKCFVSKLE
jgi:uncharacterized membrane protein YfbV (UPF0208 family)